MPRLPGAYEGDIPFLEDLYKAVPQLLSLEHDIAAGTAIYPNAVMLPKNLRTKKTRDAKIFGRDVVWGKKFALIYEPRGLNT